MTLLWHVGVASLSDSVILAEMCLSVCVCGLVCVCVCGCVFWLCGEIHVGLVYREAGKNIKVIVEVQITSSPHSSTGSTVSISA